VHWSLAGDVQALARARAALDDGKPLPMALKEARVWGAKERLFERLLPQLTGAQTTQCLQAASVVDGIAKGLKHPDWPFEPWDALCRWVLMLLQTQVGANKTLALTA
jgi:DNA polymerase III subunit delta